MKKFILLISILLSGIYLANFISAISVNKNSGEVLDNTTWTSISSLTNKIDVNSSDIKLNGKLYVTGELCSDIGGTKKCLGSCNNGKVWDHATLSCKIVTDGTSCQNIYDKGERVSQNYLIDVDGDGGNDPFKVYCDMQYDGGGWTLVMRSVKWYDSIPTVNFDSSFTDLHGDYNEVGTDFYLSKYIRAGDVPISKFRLELDGTKASIYNLPTDANTVKELFYREGDTYSNWIPPVAFGNKYSNTDHLQFPGRIIGLAGYNTLEYIANKGFRVTGMGAAGNTRGLGMFNSCNRFDCGLDSGYGGRTGIKRTFWRGNPDHYTGGYGIFGGHTTPGTDQAENDVYKIRVK
ncbi:MAG: fibrinogen-like YCDxxxxGGGW domain-containing protein [Candidatus Gracilibacteria bacterium]|nr:fibrinogen-like YCDxxxxGGGW domain-containing protein [Candidatus Gracilibacteria bacterium]